MEALSRSNPLLMIFEDVHWIDPTSLEALGRAVDRIRSLGVLLIVTYRPEFEPPWIGRPHVTALTINRLGQARNRGHDRPRHRQQAACQRASGRTSSSVQTASRLFVEEMTKAVVEAESEAERAQAVAVVPSPALAVPASLHASLMARLDRLGPAKEVAQIGAAIGREFSHALLAAVVRKPEAELQSALDRLIEAGLLFRQGSRRTRPICSSTRSCRMRHMARCCANRDVRCTPVLPKPLKANSPILPKTNPNSWRAIAPRQARSRRPRAYGVKRDSDR